jgi:hypothetical protein
MSDYAYLKDLLSWLSVARFATISKNATRKELLSSFQNCFVSIDVTDHVDRNSVYLVQSSVITRLVSFLNIEGKGDSLSDDSRLAFATSVAELLIQVKHHITMKEKHTPGSISSKMATPLEISVPRRLAELPETSTSSEPSSVVNRPRFTQAASAVADTLSSLRVVDQPNTKVVVKDQLPSMK